jgi:hypothetical protein
MMLAVHHTSFLASRSDAAPTYWGLEPTELGTGIMAKVASKDS